MVSAAVGLDVFPVLTGQFVEADPGFMMRLTLGTAAACAAVLLAAAAVSGRVGGARADAGGAEEAANEAME